MSKLDDMNRLRVQAVRERDEALAKLARIRDLRPQAAEIDDVDEERERDLEDAIASRVIAENKLAEMRKALQDIVDRYPQRTMMLPFIVVAKTLLSSSDSVASR